MNNLRSYQVCLMAIRLINKNGDASSVNWFDLNNKEDILIELLKKRIIDIELDDYEIDTEIINLKYEFRNR